MAALSVRKARKVIDEVRRKDEEVGKLLSGRRLTEIGHGQSSAVFAAGKDLVVKLTLGPVDCDYSYKLYGRGKVPGWPEVFSYVRVVFSEDEACIVVAERCVDAMSMTHRKIARRLKAAVDVVEVWFGYLGRKPLSKLEDWDSLDAEQKLWAKQLVDGLMAIDRLEEDVELDTFQGNYGLDSGGNAVWIDYGI